MTGKAVLLTIMPHASQRIDFWIEPLNEAMDTFDVNTSLRRAAFLAQIAHESGELNFIKEIWGPTEAQKGYEGRTDLGNTEIGDGSKFRGRGLIQITGRNNYRLVGNALGLPLLFHPEMLELPQYAAMSAAWFWEIHGLNILADAGDFKAITKKINGGYNGFVQRKEFYERAKAVL